MLAVPDGEERLAAPRDATTLWRDVAGGGELRVGTLAQMGAPELEACGPNEHVEVDVGANCTVLQIVKRNGVYCPVVDGVAVRSFRHGDRDVYPITAHRGLHEELLKPGVKAGHAFSPCAVAVVVEDGELLPSECKLRVWQQFGHEGSSPVRRACRATCRFCLRPWRPTSANVLYTPYPMDSGPQAAGGHLHAQGGGDQGVKKALRRQDRGVARRLATLRGRTLWLLCTDNITGQRTVPPVLGPCNGGEQLNLFRLPTRLQVHKPHQAEVRSEATTRRTPHQLKAHRFAGIAMLMAQLTGSPLGSVVSNGRGPAPHMGPRTLVLVYPTTVFQTACGATWVLRTAPSQVWSTGVEAASSAARQGLLYARRAGLRAGCLGIDGDHVQELRVATENTTTARGGGVGVVAAHQAKGDGRDAVARKTQPRIL